MRRVPYTPSRKADEVRNIALFWWSEELTAAERDVFVRAGERLVDHVRGLSEIGMVEIFFKLALLVGPELEAGNDDDV